MRQLAARHRTGKRADATRSEDQRRNTTPVAFAPAELEKNRAEVGAFKNSNAPADHPGDMDAEQASVTDRSQLTLSSFDWQKIHQRGIASST